MELERQTGEQVTEEEEQACMIEAEKLSKEEFERSIVMISGTVLLNSQNVHDVFGCAFPNLFPLGIGSPHSFRDTFVISKSAVTNIGYTITTNSLSTIKYGKSKCSNR